MPVSKLVQKPKAFCEELSSEQLEILCNIDFGKNNPRTNKRILSDEDYLIACELQFYALVELTARLEYGFSETSTDKWDALSYRNKAKKLRKIAETLSNKDEWHQEWYQVLDNIKDPTNTVKNTSLFKALIPFKSPVRLFGGRGNRVAGGLIQDEKGAARNFLPTWFPYLSIENVIEFIPDLFIGIRALFKGKRKVKSQIELNDLATKHQRQQVKALEEKAEKVSRWERSRSKFFKGSRLSRMSNAFIWIVINSVSIGFLAAGFASTAVVTLPILGIVVVVGALTSWLTLSGTIYDIFNDLTSSLYEFFNLNSLHNKFKEKSQDDDFLNKNVLHYMKKELAIKREESIVTRLFRLLSSNVTLSIAMLFIVSTAIAFPIGIPVVLGLLGACAALSLFTDVIPSLKLDYNYFNKIDKVRALVAFGFILMGIGLGIALLLGAPYLTIPLIGAFIALTVGSTGLARRIARIDTEWAKATLHNIGDAIVNLKDKVVNFCKHAIGIKESLDSTPLSPQRNLGIEVSTGLTQSTGMEPEAPKRLLKSAFTPISNELAFAIEECKKSNWTVKRNVSLTFENSQLLDSPKLAPRARSGSATLASAQGIFKNKNLSTASHIDSSLSRLATLMTVK